MTTKDPKGIKSIIAKLHNRESGLVYFDLLIQTTDRNYSIATESIPKELVNLGFFETLEQSEVFLLKTKGLIKHI